MLDVECGSEAKLKGRQGFEELEVWQLARALTNRVYRFTKTFPPDEKYGLTLQMRRAAVLTMSNIAEGWGRHSQASFANFLDFAQGSLSELLSQGYVALDQGFLAEADFSEFRAEADTLGAKLFRFIERLRPQVVREAIAFYGEDKNSLEATCEMPHPTSDIRYSTYDSK